MIGPGKERQGFQLIGEVAIYEETAPLRRTLTWGPAGIECVLSLFVPPDRSLFFDQMNVPIARAQFDQFESILMANGVEVIRVKDLLAEWFAEYKVEPLVKSLHRFSTLIKDKGFYLHRKYGRGDLHILDWVDPILREEAGRYGDERVVLLLNQALVGAGNDDLPLGGMIFGRDQSNVVGNTLVWSNMRYEIRRPEVGLWQTALFGKLNAPQVRITGEGRFEGGDLIVNHGICYVGVGGRTNLTGVAQMAEAVLSQGLRLMVVYHPDRDNGKLEHQTVMHLDTFAMPYLEHAWVVYPEEAAAREVREIVIDGGALRWIQRGNFLEHLVDQRGVGIVEINRQQQLDYQANFVCLGNDRIITTVNGSGKLREDLSQVGVTPINAQMDEITQGYGGAHCSLTPFLRG